MFGEVVLSCRNWNHLKVVSKMLVLSRRLREAQGMDNLVSCLPIVMFVCLLLFFVVFFAEGAWVCQTTYILLHDWAGNMGKYSVRGW